MDNFIKQGQDLYKSGKITNEDLKDAGAAFSNKDGGDFATKAKRLTLIIKKTIKVIVIRKMILKEESK